MQAADNTLGIQDKKGGKCQEQTKIKIVKKKKKNVRHKHTRVIALSMLLG